MPYVVDSVWGISCCITPTCRNRIRPKSEELATPGPVKGSQTRRVCTLGMLFLIEGVPLNISPLGAGCLL